MKKRLLSALCAVMLLICAVPMALSLIHIYQAQDHVPLFRHAAVFGGVAVEAGSLQLIAESGLIPVSYTHLGP